MDVSSQRPKRDDFRDKQFPYAGMAGCECPDGNSPAAPFFRDFHPGRQHRIVRSCTSDSGEYPNATLIVERGTLTLGEGESP